jgi:hypothetical protein
MKRTIKLLSLVLISGSFLIGSASFAQYDCDKQAESVFDSCFKNVRKSQKWKRILNKIDKCNAKDWACRAPLNKQCYDLMKPCMENEAKAYDKCQKEHKADTKQPLTAAQ